MPILPTSVTELVRKYRRQGIQLVHQVGPLAAFGEMLTADIDPKFQYTFPYEHLSTELWRTNHVNSGSAAVGSDGVLEVSTGTTTGSTGEVETKNVVFYHAGMGAGGRFTTRFSANNTSNSDGSAWVGILDDEDGFAVGYQNGVFGFLHRVRSVDNFTPASDWYIDPLNGRGPSGITIDPTKGNLWKVEFQYLGFGGITLSYGDPVTFAWLDVHAVQYANANTATSLGNPSLPFTIEVKNGTSILDVKAGAGSCVGYIQGKSEGLGEHFSTTEIGTTFGATEKALLAIRSKSTFYSKTNRVEALVRTITAAINGTKPAIIRVYKDPSITGGTWNDVDAVESCMEANVTMTGWTGGRVIDSEALSGGDRGVMEYYIDKLPLERDQSLLITAEGFSGGSGIEATSTITWLEER